MYKVVSLISTIIRGFYIPNPFEYYFKNDLWYIESKTVAEIFNIIVGGAILHYSSFILASSIYKSREMPKTIGSICYLISFILNTILMNYLCLKLEDLKLDLIILIYFFVDLLLYFIIVKAKRIIQEVCIEILEDRY